MSQMVEKMDGYGLGAWIALMVLSFILFWPAGLAMLAFLIWSGRMGFSRHGDGAAQGRWESRVADMQGRFRRWGCRGSERRQSAMFAPSGNRAFDEYREETLRRLEEEAQEFTAFLDRLRHAKDKAEFDQFMAERRDQPTGPSNDSPRNGDVIPPTR